MSSVRFRASFKFRSLLKLCLSRGGRSAGQKHQNESENVQRKFKCASWGLGGAGLGFLLPNVIFPWNDLLQLSLLSHQYKEIKLLQCFPKIFKKQKKMFQFSSSSFFLRESTSTLFLSCVCVSRRVFFCFLPFFTLEQRPLRYLSRKTRLQMLKLVINIRPGRC